MGKTEKTTEKVHKSSKKSRLEDTDSPEDAAESLSGEAAIVDTKGMSARQAKKALKSAAATKDSVVAIHTESSKAGTDDATSKTKRKIEDRINKINKISTDTKVINSSEKREDANIPDTSGLSAREAKRIKKAAKRAAQEKSGIETSASASASLPDVNGRATTSSKKSVAKTGTIAIKSQAIEERQQAAPAPKMSKNLLARQEKTRRDAQRAIQKFVAELREKGITDSKAIKKEKIKFKKKLVSSKQARGYKSR